jgi:phosphate transport system protein
MNEEIHPMTGETMMYTESAGHQDGAGLATTRHRFDKELETLRSKSATMLTMTGAMLTEALEALRTQEPELCAEVLREDDAIDAQDHEIEAQCLRLLALQQPVVASDLRLVSTVLKSVDDIERIGDHAVNIAKTADRMRDQQIALVPEIALELPLLGKMVLEMLERTADALRTGSTSAACHVISNDDEIDVLYAELRREWQYQMRQISGQPLLLSYLLFVAHYLERIGDHCKNIAERIVFCQTGEGKEQK